MIKRSYFVKCWLKIVNNKLGFYFLKQCEEAKTYTVSSVPLQMVPNDGKAKGWLSKTEYALTYGLPYSIACDPEMENGYLEIKGDLDEVEIVLSQKLFDQLELVS